MLGEDRLGPCVAILLAFPVLPKQDEVPAPMCSNIALDYHSTYHVAPGAVYQSVSTPSTVSTQRVRTSPFGLEPGTQWILDTSLLNG